MAKLISQALLDYCADHYVDKRTDLVRGAGYIKDNDKTNYAAKMQALAAYQAICEYQCQVLTEDEFIDIYRGNYSTEAEFAKECEEDLLGENSYLLKYINWQDVWEGEYKDDHVSISHSDGVYIYSHL